MIPWSPTASSPSSRASSRSPEVEDRSAGAPAGSPAPRGKRDGLLQRREGGGQEDLVLLRQQPVDRKSTRLNSSHDQISYAVFCLKKKKSVHITYDVRRL